jgi:aspartoacylase
MNTFELSGAGEKNILILAGVHGNELTSIYCAYILKENLLAAHSTCKNKMFKKITILNNINIEGVRKNTREIPTESNEDLNRMFSNETSLNLKEDLQKYFEENDVIIDIHTSPSCTEFVLINQDEYANSYIKYAKEHNIDYLIRYNNSNTIKKFCLENNKISFTIELNKIGSIDHDSAKKGMELIENIINNIDNFELKKSEPTNDTYIEFFHHKEGLFLPQKKLGEIVLPGEIIGMILDLKTLSHKTIVIYNKSFPSKIICDSGNSYVSASNSICYMQPIEIAVE